MKKLCILLTLCLLAAAMPALALENPVVEMNGPQQVFETTGLLIPIPYYVETANYSVIDGTVAQADFTYNDARFTLRLEKTPAFQDISGVNGGFEMSDWYMEDYEGLEDFACTTGYNDQDQELTLWFDSARGVSGSLYVEDILNSADAETEQILYSLARGVCLAEMATHQNGSYAFPYPVMLTEDPARTETINRTIADCVAAIGEAHDSTATFKQHYCVRDYYKGRMTIEWAGWTEAPGAAYSPFEIIGMTVDLATGELAPLRTQIDTAEYAELIMNNLSDYYSYVSWDDVDLNTAQLDYLKGFTLEDWQALLDNTDFPSDSGWPTAFSRWSHDEYETNLLLNIPVSHALGDQASVIVTLE